MKIGSMRVGTGGVVGALVAVVASVLGYRRYRSVKVGDRVNVSSIELQQLGVPAGQKIEAKVVTVGPGDSVGVAPILGGVQAPMSVPVRLSEVENLTPRLI